jgi:hypothetical protein
VSFKVSVQLWLDAEAQLKVVRYKSKESQVRYKSPANEGRKRLQGEP